MQAFKRMGAIVAAILLLVAFAGPGAVARQAPSPEDIYRHAWQLIRDTYYDTTYGGQDWSAWEKKYEGKLASVDDSYKAIDEMLKSLKDPYSRLLDPSAFKDENDAINAVVVGIGISLKPNKEQSDGLVINQVIQGGPAFRAGIRSGDRIVAINDKPCAHYTIDMAAREIRGPQGTSVKLTIHGAEGEAFHTLVRQHVSIPAVTTRMLPGNIGCITLSTFMSDSAAREFRNALTEMRTADGLIVDLRGNPGGLMANALEIADMLLPGGKIVSTVSRRGKLTDSASGYTITRQPMVLIIDKDSASASEILAAALKENRRATLVGNRTFGKGLVQEINRLPGGAGVHITVARYFTPGGEDINKVGVSPDIPVDGQDEQMQTALNIIQRQLASRPAKAPSAPGGRALDTISDGLPIPSRGG